MRQRNYGYNQPRCGTGDRTAGRVLRGSVQFHPSGSYLQEVKFINELERDKMFFLIDGVALGEQQGNVRLQLKLETYLRSGAETS